MFPDPVIIKAGGRDIAVEDPGPGSGFPVFVMNGAGSRHLFPPAVREGRDPLCRSEARTGQPALDHVLSAAADNDHMRSILETGRLRLRRFTEQDVSNLFDLNSDAEVMRFINGGKPTPAEEIRDKIIPFHLAVYERYHGLGTWAAESISAGEFLGWFHLRPGPGEDRTNVDLGYRLRRAAWNKGYATEGSRALIRTAFTDLGVERIFAHTMTVNTASRRVMEKCGLTLVRTIPHEGPDTVPGSAQGEVEYALTRADWAHLR